VRWAGQHLGAMESSQPPPKTWEEIRHWDAPPPDPPPSATAHLQHHGMPVHADPTEDPGTHRHFETSWPPTFAARFPHISGNLSYASHRKVAPRNFSSSLLRNGACINTVGNGAADYARYPPVKSPFLSRCAIFTSRFRQARHLVHFGDSKAMFHGPSFQRI
jgi:hypothetical protein